MSIDMYRAEILDHARHPRNRGKLPHSTATARVSNPLCGDVIDLGVVFEKKSGRVKEAAFEAEACAISVAAASILTEKIKGKTRKKLSELDEDDIVAWLGGSLTPSRVECALLPLKALREALER